jgi:hypothetical protein
MTEQSKKDLVDAERAAQAVWQYVTSVKLIQKRDGRKEDFQIEKLERSLVAAFGAAGKQDDFLARGLTEEVYDRLQKRFDGIAVPTADQVRETAVSVLSDHQLGEIAHHYTSTRPPKVTKVTMTVPTPPMPMQPVPSTPAGESYVPRRRRLSDERKAITHKFQIGSHEGYIIVGLYDDGTPGEIFITMNKQGSVIRGLMDSFATSISIGLQYGVPLKVLVNKFAHVRFEPNGATQNPNIPTARSIMDYLFRWLALKFLSPEERQSIGIHAGEDRAVDPMLLDAQNNVDGARQSKLLETSTSSQ